MKAARWHQPEYHPPRTSINDKADTARAHLATKVHNTCVAALQKIMSHVPEHPKNGTYGKQMPPKRLSR